MRSPVSCELGTCSISSESSPSTIWGAAAVPPGLHEPVWAELDRHALRLFGPRRKPVREGQGLLRKQRRRTDPPIAGLAPSRRYLAGVAKRYCARPPQPRRRRSVSHHDLLPTMARQCHGASCMMHLVRLHRHRLPPSRKATKALT